MSAERIAELERENAAIRTLMNSYNLGGWTDSLTLLQRAEAAESRVQLLEHDMKSGDYETLYAQVVEELKASESKLASAVAALGEKK